MVVRVYEAGPMLCVVRPTRSSALERYYVTLLYTWQLRLGNDLINVRARELEHERLLGKNPQGFADRTASGPDCKIAGNCGSKDMMNWILPNSIEAALCATTTQVTDYMKAVQRAVQQVHGHEILMIPSHCVLQSTLIGKGAQGGENKNFGSIVLKIRLQMNCNMEGFLWKANTPVVGYDLYQDSTMKGKTTGASVSTFNSDFMQFYSQTPLRENPIDFRTNLTHLIRKARRKYYLANGNTA